MKSTALTCVGSAVTADPTQVAAVEFVIRAESYGVPDSKSGYQTDTLAIRVAVRG